MTISGLTSAQTSVPLAGLCQIICSLSLPMISKGSSANSQVVTVIKQNGSTMYTSSAGAEGFQISLSCAANDVISVTLSSAAAVDQSLNVIKANVSIG